MVEGRRTLLEMECELDDGEGPAGSDTQGRPSGVGSSSSEFNRFLICSSWNSCYIQRGSRPRASGSAHLHVTWALAETGESPAAQTGSKTLGFKSGHPYWGEVRGTRTKTAIL